MKALFSWVMKGRCDSAVADVTNNKDSCKTLDTTTFMQLFIVGLVVTIVHNNYVCAHVSYWSSNNLL